MNTRARCGAALLALLVAVPLEVALVAGPAQAVAAEVEAPDFASETYADAWDYSNAADQNTDLSTARNVAVSDGRLQMDITGGSSFDPVASVPGSLAYGRDGAALSIDTARYTHISFKMNQPSSGVGAVYYFTCRDMLPSCAGGVTFGITPGDNVYNLDLSGASTIGARVPWSGRMVAMRIIPSISLPTSQQIHASIDWLRIYAPVTAHAAYPPGSYGGFSIESLPQPVIDSPNASEGQDLATAQRGRPWDFTNSANAAGISVSSGTVLAYDSRGMTARNSAPNINDPQVNLNVAAFDAARFHNLSFDLTYDGPFDLGDGAGGGKLARLVWQVAGSGTYQEINDIVTFAGRNAGPISIDLTNPATSLLDENSVAPRLGWTGAIRTLRFDPNEDPSANIWHLKNVSLRADPAALGSTTVRFHDAAWVAGTTASVLVGTGAPGTPYTTIASGIAVQNGVNSTTFNLGSMPAGAYRVQVILRHPAGGAALSYSKTAITMTPDTRNDPRGSFDSVVRAPGGLIVSGWAFDPNTTSPIGVHAYVDGRFVAALTADLSRPDVERAVPGAGPLTGYSKAIPVGSGQHSVCLYGINTGAGANALIGCRQVTVDNGRPLGSLDSVTASGGVISAAGWAIDPDTADPIAVHVYVGATGKATTANAARSDVARAWPAYGSAHGYATSLAVAAGTYQVCAYAIGTSSDNTQLGCRSVSVGSNAPIGSLDGATRTGGSVNLRGWTIDADTTGSIRVHVYVNGIGAANVIAGLTRADVGRAFPAFGAEHGYDVTVNAASGSTLCAYAINEGPGGSTTLGCRVV